MSGVMAHVLVRFNLTCDSDCDLFKPLWSGGQFYGGYFSDLPVSNKACLINPDQALLFSLN